jgi:glucokinase
LQHQLGVPAYADNDAVAAAVGEAAWGAGRGTTSFVYLTISTGIGCGVVLNGQVLRGAGDAHGESGHQVIDLDPQAPLCFCGARGCWEVLASGTAMTRRWREQHPHSPWTVKEICAAAWQGDPAALSAVAEEGRLLGVGIANLVTHFVPQVIALGGGVMESFDLFLPQMEAQVRAQCGLVPWQRTRIERAHFRYHAALVGAAALCRGLW